MSLGPFSKTINLTQLLLRNNRILVNATRNHWNKDFKPLPFPKTEKECLAAAQKYEVHPAEYKAYPDDGTGYGDYPVLPLESADSRDDNYPWDNPELKRNYNEPLHVDFDLIRQDRYDVSVRLRQPLYMYFVQFFGVLGGFLVFYLASLKFKMFHAAVPRQYPKDGKVHYTFDPK